MAEKRNLNDPTSRSIVLLLASLGFPQHRIAALFDVNQGRIAEIVKPAREITKDVK